MNISQLKTFLIAAIPAGLPVLIKGVPGIGKTDIIKTVAKEIKQNLLIFHPCVDEPTDYKGLPALIDGKAVFLPYNNLVDLMEANEPTIAFFDDLGQAEPSVQKALMQIFLAREINGKKISDNITFIAATNRKQDKAGVNGLLEPVKSRFASIVELEVDHKSWIEWALQANLNIGLISFIQFRPNLLQQFAPTNDLINSPCPRTVANLSKLMDLNLPDDLKYQVYSGAVGEAFTTELLAFLPIMKQLPKIENILNGNDTEPPARIDVSFAVCAVLAKRVNEINSCNVFPYIEKMISEFQVLFVKTATKEKPEIMETREFKIWANKNSDILI